MNSIFEEGFEISDLEIAVFVITTVPKSLVPAVLSFMDFLKPQIGLDF